MDGWMDGYMHLVQVHVGMWRGGRVTLQVECPCYPVLVWWRRVLVQESSVKSGASGVHVHRSVQHRARGLGVSLERACMHVRVTQGERERAAPL